MKLKFPKTVTITSITFNVRKDNNSDGASLDLANREIKIGTKHLTTDPNYVFELICHELMEIVCILTSTRYDDYWYRDWETDRKSTRLNSSHRSLSRMPSSA